MEALFKKLNYKEHRIFAIIDIPEELTELNKPPFDLDVLDTTLNPNRNYEFLLIFILKREDIESAVDFLEDNLADDAVIWFAYPKNASKKYKCEINRDTGWESLGKLNLEPVRQVAVSEDWSALRFRNVKNIKTMKRKGMAISKEGKERIKGN